MTSPEVSAHIAAGRALRAAGLNGFVREAGSGEPVVCVHGVPTSSYLYRKVLDELAARGLRGVAFDLPGLGLADRPRAFDYSWTGLGRYCVAAVDALELGAFHLVVHDTSRRPWSMEPFARRGLGEVYLRTLSKPAFRVLMSLQGVADRSSVTNGELDAYVELLKREDGGRAFLHHARLRAHGRQARALPLGAAQRSVSGAGHLG